MCDIFKMKFQFKNISLYILLQNPVKYKYDTSPIQTSSHPTSYNNFVVIINYHL